MAIEKRLLKWLNERFPFIHVFSSFILYFLVVFVSRCLPAGKPVYLSRSDFFSAIGVAAVFLLLRIYDEHKDFASDSILYPERVLQSGVVTLGELRKLGIGCALFTLFLSICHGGPALLAWIFLSAWAHLMYKEFFCASWLRSKLLIYAVSHMLIVPFLIAWILKLGPRMDLLQAPIFTLAALAFLSGLTFEIGRKLRGKDEEREGQDSYSKSLGYARGSTLLISLLVCVLGFEIALLIQLPLTQSFKFMVLPVLAFLLSVVTVFRYSKNPTLKARKANEAITGLFLLVNYLSLIAAAWIQFGISF